MEYSENLGQDAFNSAPVVASTGIHAEKRATVAAGNTSDVVIRSLMDLLVMPVGMIQPQERAFAADLLKEVAQTADRESQKLLVDRVAGLSDAPASLVRWLLNEFDDATVEPLIRDGACITAHDLVALINSASMKRLRMIAERNHLPCVATAALVIVADRDVLIRLLTNGAAQIDEPTMMWLTERASGDAALADVLVKRPEMTPACALGLFWSLPAKQRSYVLGRFLTDCQVLPQVLVMARPGGDLIAGALRCAGQHPPTPGEEPTSAGTRAKSRAMTADMMTAIEEGDHSTVSTFLVQLGLAGREAAERIVSDPGCEALAVACKAAGISRFAFESACRTRFANSVGAVSPGEMAERLQIIFDTLSFKKARMALTYWNWQACRIGPYEALDTSMNDREVSAA